MNAMVIIRPTIKIHLSWAVLRSMYRITFFDNPNVLAASNSLFCVFYHHITRLSNIHAKQTPIYLQYTMLICQILQKVLCLGNEIIQLWIGWINKSGFSHGKFGSGKIRIFLIQLHSSTLCLFDLFVHLLKKTQLLFDVCLFLQIGNHGFVQAVEPVVAFWALQIVFASLANLLETWIHDYIHTLDIETSLYNPMSLLQCSLLFDCYHLTFS